MTEERLTKIESLLVHQDQQIQDLSDMINLQRKEIDILTRRLDKTQAKMMEFQDGGQGAVEGSPLGITEQAARDKPPHY